MLLSIIFLLFFALVSYIVGKNIVKLFRIGFDNNLENFVFSTAIGFGVIGYLIFALGLLGLLYWWVCLILMLILFGFSLWEIWKSRAFFKSIRQNFKDKLLGGKIAYFELALLIILVIGNLMMFISSLAPPTEIDSAVYHLAVPKSWLQNHSIYYIPYIIPAEYPSLVETLYTLGMSLTNDLSASLIAWLFGVMMILSMLSFCRRYLSFKIGLLSATAFCVTPLFAKLSIGTLVDMAVGYYAFLAFYLILIYHDTDNRNMLVLSGIMSGLACATKHSGLVPFAVLVVWLLILEVKRRKSHRHWLLSVIIFFLIAFLIPTPWYIKSYINMGNPTVVYFTKIFGGRNLLPSDDSNMIVSWRYQQSFQSESAFANIKILKLLWRTFFNDIFFWSLGVFFLMSVPLLAMIRKMNKSVKYGLLYSAITFVLYSIVTDQPRLIVPAFPFLFISASYAFHWAFEKNGSFAKIMQIIVIIALLPNLIPIARTSSLKYPVVMGLMSRDQYLSSWVDIYDTIQYANQNLGDDVRILTIDPRGYYFDKPYIVGLQITQGFIRFDGIKNAQEMMSLLKTYGITHLLLKNKSSMTIPYIDKLIPRLRVVYSDGDVYLFTFRN